MNSSCAEGAFLVCLDDCNELLVGNADRYLANKTSEFLKNSEVYLIIRCYPVSFAKPTFPHPQAADLLLGNTNMECTLETHSALGVIRCLQGADGQHSVLPGYGRAFQPAFRNLACDSGRAC
jgi:hypothetical protein